MVAKAFGIQERLGRNGINYYDLEKSMVSKLQKRAFFERHVF